MAQEGSEASVASLSPAANWWEMSANPTASWNAINHSHWAHAHQPHVSNSCDDQDVPMSTNSFANVSNHSGLSIDSASADAGDHSDNHIWNQVLMGVGNSEGIHQRSHGGSEKFLEVLSSKNLTNQMFDPACDYLKKLDSGWEFTSNSSSLNALEKHLNSYNNGEDMIDSEGLTNNLSDVVSNWSIAPPNPHMDLMNPHSMPAHTTSHVPHINHELPGSPSFSNFHSYVHELVKADNQQNEMVGFSFGTSLINQIGLSNSIIGLNNSGLMADAPWSISVPRNLSDLISFSSLNKPAMEYGGCYKPSTKCSVPSDGSKKAGHNSSSSTNGSRRGSGTTSEGKKKRIEYSSETIFKKPKHESTLQAPKVKVAGKIASDGSGAADRPMEAWAPQPWRPWN